MIIYKVTNKINGKIYIGQTKQSLRKRWNDHCCRQEKNRSHYFYRAVQLHGKENFIVEQIDSAGTLEALNVLEEFYIKKFNSLAPNGYNLLPGGENRACHDETREKISQTLKGRPIPNRWGKGNSTPCTEETKAKISAKLKGRPIEHRWTGGNKAPRTQEQKDHLSKLNKGVPNKALYKPVLAVETDTVYESVNAAAKALGVNRVTISGLLKSGKQGRLGLSFKFMT